MGIYRRQLPWTEKPPFGRGRLPSLTLFESGCVLLLNEGGGNKAYDLIAGSELSILNGVFNGDGFKSSGSGINAGTYDNGTGPQSWIFRIGSDYSKPATNHEAVMAKRDSWAVGTTRYQLARNYATDTLRLQNKNYLAEFANTTLAADTVYIVTHAGNGTTPKIYVDFEFAENAAATFTYDTAGGAVTTVSGVYDNTTEYVRGTVEYVYHIKGELTAEYISNLGANEFSFLAPRIRNYPLAAAAGLSAPPFRNQYNYPQMSALLTR